MTAEQWDAINAKVDAVEAHVIARVEAVERALAGVVARIDARSQPVCVPPDRACETFGFSRSTFDRWLADPAEGLERGPEPVVLRPNGPTGKVMVHVERMQRWLDARGRKPKLRMA